MKISRELSGQIEAALREYVAGTVPDLVKFDEPLDVRRLAGELNMLPMLFDMGGCYGIRPSGEIVSFSWDEPHKLDVEEDPRIQNVVLFQGTKKYPALKDLMPVRSPDSITCSHCEGTGRLKGLPEVNHIICYCGGLGWLPESEGQ
jgi:hypothetical protein